MENSEIDSIRRSALIWRSIGVGAISFNLFVSVVAIIRTMDTLKQEPAREVVKAPAPPSPVSPRLIDIKDDDGHSRVQVGAIGKGAYGIAVANSNGTPTFVVADVGGIALMEFAHPTSRTKFAFEADEHGGVLLKVSFQGHEKIVMGVDSNGLTQFEAANLDGRTVFKIPKE